MRCGPAPAASGGAPVTDLRVIGSAEVDQAQAWLARARGGDDDAFGELVRHFEADVQRLCRRLLGSAAEAEDAAQDCFLRAHGALGRYDPARPFRPWLLAIAARRSIDLLRRRQREARIFELGEREGESPSPAAATPLDHGLSAERRARLLRAVEALPDRYRAPLVLRYYADLDFAEIAEILAVSRNQVATLLFRGRQRLREAFAEERP